MSNTVFILGAGASFEAGAPLMDNFLDVAFNLWKTGRVHDQSPAFEIVNKGLAALQKTHSKSALTFNNL